MDEPVPANTFRLTENTPVNLLKIGVINVEVQDRPADDFTLYIKENTPRIIDDSHRSGFTNLDVGNVRVGNRSEIGHIAVF